VIDLRCLADEDEHVKELLDFGGPHATFLDLDVSPQTVTAPTLVASQLLLHGFPKIYLFVSLDNGQLQLGGRQGSQLQIRTIKTAGVWQVAVRTQLKGISDSHQYHGTPAWFLDRTDFIFFKWDGINVPVPHKKAFRHP
jgi:hypothetical protein